MDKSNLYWYPGHIQDQLGRIKLGTNVAPGIYYWKIINDSNVLIGSGLIPIVQ